MSLPSTVTKLDDWAFCNCSNLAEVRLNEGLQTIGEHAFSKCSVLQSVIMPTTVTELSKSAFCCCQELSEVHFNEGLQLIGEFTFFECTALRSVTIPSTVTKLDYGALQDCSNLSEVILLGGGMLLISQYAFYGCRKLAEVQFNEGLQSIGSCAFEDCTALRSVTLPSTVTELGAWAFNGCINLSEVILLGGGMFLNQDFFARGFSGLGLGLVNQRALDEIFFDEPDERLAFAFCDCPLTAVKISISWAVSERMARLLPKCRISVEERIRNLPRLDLMQDGNVVACFPVVNMTSEDNAESDSDDEAEDFNVQVANFETARSVYKVLQLIAFHELEESCILIDLAMWKSRIDANQARTDCRGAIPGPA